MAYLLDTNILLRIAQPNHAMHREAKQCVHSLLRRKEAVHIVPQIIFEFWVESLFRLMLDTQSIYHEWLRLVTSGGAFCFSGLP